MSRRRSVSALAIALVAGAALLAPGCASKGPKKPDKITQELLTQPKEVLFEKGKDLLARKKYEEARKYLNHVFETYPNETMGRESLLLVADSYFAQKSTTGYTEARYRYRDYLNRYPGAPRRDYARYQFALCYDKEHEKPDRDQTATREAIDQYRALIREFPDSGYAGAARERVRQLTDLLAEHDFGIGYFYLRKGSTAAALSRFTSLEQRYPDYGAKDKLYYYEAIALGRLGRKDEARRFYDRIIEEFPQSEYARKARSRVGGKPAEKPSAAPAAAAAVDSKPESQ
jgi:outer membrane protein assembly factor BamD